MAAERTQLARLSNAVARLIKFLVQIRMGGDRFESDDREPQQRRP
jgi:hypothetical protein